MCGLSFVVGGGAVVFVNSRNIPFKFGQNGSVIASILLLLMLLLMIKFLKVG